MQQKIYKDLNINFLPHPITGDISQVFDENSVKQAVKTLVLTNFFERPFDPTAGSNVTSFLFEPVSPIIEDALESTIKDVIEIHEPRASVDLVKVKYNEDLNSYDVTIEFSILGLDNPIQISFVLNRVR